MVFGTPIIISKTEKYNNKTHRKQICLSTQSKTKNIHKHNESNSIKKKPKLQVKYKYKRLHLIYNGYFCIYLFLTKIKCKQHPHITN